MTSKIHPIPKPEEEIRKTLLRNKTLSDKAFDVLTDAIAPT